VPTEEEEVLENSVFRGFLGAKKEEVKCSWRKSHIAELHDLYPSPAIIRAMKLRLMRWGEACVGEMINA
jgi:hypothetical protein